jgi:hypothetical protein
MPDKAALGRRREMSTTLKSDFRLANGTRPKRKAQAYRLVDHLHCDCSLFALVPVQRGKNRFAIGHRLERAIR